MAMLTKTVPTILLASLFLFGASAVRAADGPALVGFWGGHPDGVDNHPVYLWVRKNGDCAYSEPSSGVILSGVCEYNQTSPIGGVLTLHYITVTVTQTFHNKLYLGITWLDNNSMHVRLGTGPHETGVLKRL
jgi:hypothetical protein